MEDDFKCHATNTKGSYGCKKESVQFFIRIDEKLSYLKNRISYCEEHRNIHGLSHWRECSFEEFICDTVLDA